jgi:hypothetical protein
MITAKKISKPELPKLVDMTYQGDTELFDKYYAPERVNHEAAVLTTLQYVHELGQSFKLNYYKILHHKKPVGYFITFDDFLYSFAIEKNSRKKEVLSGWFELVKKELGDTFKCVLYNYNTRAIKHLERHGMKKVEEDIDTKTVLLIKN